MGAPFHLSPFDREPGADAWARARSSRRPLIVCRDRPLNVTPIEPMVPASGIVRALEWATILAAGTIFWCAVTCMVSA